MTYLILVAVNIYSPKQHIRLRSGTHRGGGGGEGGGGGYSLYFSYKLHMYRQNAPLFDDFSLAGHLKNDHLLSICPTFLKLVK